MPMQVASISDFSGGFTDLYIDGPANQCARNDNWLLHEDNYAFVRAGTTLFNPELPNFLGTTNRISGIINYNQDSDLFFTTGSQLYYVDTTGPLDVLTELNGIGTNNFFSSSADQGVSTSHWQGHLLATHEQRPYLTKLYKNASGTYVAVTAGLPELKLAANNISDATLLTNGIALANDLRTQLLAHMNDQGTINPNLHKALDPARATLAAVAVASDTATLYTLVTALLVAYNLHVKDTLPYKVIAGSLPTYHYGTYTATSQWSNINVISRYTTAPTTLTEAALRLDDLKQKYYWHSWATASHGNPDHTNADYFAGQYGANAVTVAAIGAVSDRPIITPNLTETYAFANGFKTAFNLHVADTTQHWVADPNTISAAAATTETTLYNLIHHSKVMVYLHSNDVPAYNPSSGASLTVTYTQGTLHSTSGSANLTVWATSPGYSYNPSTGMIYVPIPVIGTYPFATKAAAVSSFAGTTVTMDRNANVTDATLTAGFLVSKYHAGARIGGSATTWASLPLVAAFVPGSDLSSWNDQIWTLAQSYTAHLNHDDSYGTVDTTFNLPIYHRTYTSTSSGFYITNPKPQVVSLAYAFHYSYPYTDVNQVEYEDVGPTYVSEAVLSNPPVPTSVLYPTFPANYLPYFPLATIAEDDRINLSITNPYLSATSSIGVSNIASITNGSTTNYDTSVLVVKVFRTLDAGSVFRFLGNVSNGTSTYSDTTNDTLVASQEITPLESQEPIYTTGNVVDYDPPMKAKTVTVLSGIGYIGNLVDPVTGEIFTKRVMQSVPGQPASYPGDFFDDMDSDVVAVTSVRDVVVVLSTRHVARLQGQFNRLGQGSMVHINIADTVGCVSASSVVQVPGGVLFAGTDGMYLTDGYQMVRINEHHPDFYLSITDSAARANRISGVYDSKTRRVYWAFQREITSEDNDAILVLDLNFGLKPQSSFSTLSGPWAPTALGLDNGEVIFGDRYGYGYRFDDQFHSDPMVDKAVSADLWTLAPVVYDYISCATSFGAPGIRKWVPKISMNAKGTTNQSVQLVSINDDGRRTDSLTPLRYREIQKWGDPDHVWGDTQQRWNYQGALQIDRRVPSGALRCTYKQVQVTNANVMLYNSAMRGTATLDRVVKTLTLEDSAQTWETDIVGDFIYFEFDRYTQAFEVLERTSDTVVTLKDYLGFLPPTATGLKWLVKGYPNDERLVLVELSMPFAAFSDSRTGSDGQKGAP